MLLQRVPQICYVYGRKGAKVYFRSPGGKVLASANDPWIQKGLNSNAARFSMAAAVTHFHFSVSFSLVIGKE